MIQRSLLTCLLLIPILGSTLSAQDWESSEPLINWNLKSDSDFNDFISPMTNPVFFEDPRMLTEIRFIFADHDLPARLGGDDLQFYAAQIRARLTDNISFIATKDGFIDSNSPIAMDGWADVSAGLKVNLFSDADAQVLLSSGFTYEIPAGNSRALQGNGDGEFNIFVTGGAEIFENVHWLSAAGIRLPSDKFVENQSVYWSNHVDMKIGDSVLYVFGEANWYHWIRDANVTPANFAGLDLVNLGSTMVEGNNVVTTALGVKIKPADNIEFGVAYEIPASSREDILDQRITADLIIRY